MGPNYLEMEVSRLKGTLEATKQYYAVLIAKNVEKVERCLELVTRYTGSSKDELLQEITNEVVALDKKSKRVKSRAVKKLYSEIIELKQENFTMQQNFYNLVSNIEKNLKQIL